MTKAEKEIYEYGNKILKTGSDSFDWISVSTYRKMYRSAMAGQYVK